MESLLDEIRLFSCLAFVFNKLEEETEKTFSIVTPRLLLKLIIDNT